MGCDGRDVICCNWNVRSVFWLSLPDILSFHAIVSLFGQSRNEQNPAGGAGYKLMIHKY
jgi:hypothetical protein